MIIVDILQKLHAIFRRTPCVFCHFRKVWDLIGTQLNQLNALNWLSNSGVSEFAQTVKNNYLTGTAVTIIVALLILLVGPKKTSGSKIMSFVRRCPVCDHRLIGSPNWL